MKQVRIVIVHDYYVDYEDSKTVMAEGISDWEMVTDEEHKLLVQNWSTICYEMNLSAGKRAVLIEKDDQPVQVRIDSVKRLIQAAQEKQDRLAAERKATAEARARKKLLKEAETERKLLAELKAKYPDA